MTKIDYKSSWYTDMKPHYKEFDQNSTYWEMKYYDRWQKLMALLPVDKMLEPKVLEIGCGMGRALSYFKRHGAIVKGVEPSDYAIENNRLLTGELIHADFLDIEVPGKYDLVYIEQVLSHISQYQEVLKRAYYLLEDDGLIAVEEPNDGNALQMRLIKDKGAYWMCPDHCNYFTSEQLETAIEDAGFEVVYRSATFPMELFELMGLKYIGDEEAGKEVHLLRTKLIEGLGSELRTKIKEAFASIGLGRDTYLICRKAGGKNG